MSKVCQAALKGDLAELKRLVAAGEDLRQQDVNGTPLQNAAMGGHIDVMEWLVDQKGFSLTAKISKRIAVPFDEIKSEEDKTAFYIFTNEKKYGISYGNMVYLKADGTLGTGKETKIRLMRALINDYSENITRHDEGKGVLSQALNTLEIFKKNKKKIVVAPFSRLEDIPGINIGWINYADSYGEQMKHPSAEEAKIISPKMLEVIKEIFKKYHKVIVKELKENEEGVEPIIPMQVGTNKSGKLPPIFFAPVSEIAIGRRHLPVLQWLAKKKYVFQHGDISAAIVQNNVPVLEFLAKQGCVFTKQDIYDAIRLGSLDALKWLIDGGNCVLIGNKNSINYGSVYIGHAATYDRREVLKWLVNEKKCVLTKDLAKAMAIKACTPSKDYYYGDLNLLKWLIIANKELLSVRNEEGLTLTLLAAKYGLLDHLKYLMDEQHCSLEDRDNKNNNIVAISIYHAKIIKWLVDEKGVQLNEENLIIIAKAAIWKDEDLLIWLIEVKKWDPNTFYAHDCTENLPKRVNALMVASKNYESFRFQYLLINGADPAIQFSTEETVAQSIAEGKYAHSDNKDKFAKFYKVTDKYKTAVSKIRKLNHRNYSMAKINLIQADAETDEVLSLFKIKLLLTESTKDKIFEIALKAPGFLKEKLTDTFYPTISSIDFWYKLIQLMDEATAARPESNKYKEYLHAPVDLLFHFIELGDLEAVKAAVAAGVNPGEWKANVVNAMHVAAACGKYLILAYFIDECGMNPSINTRNGCPTLHLPADSRLTNLEAYKKTITFLIKNCKFDINLKAKIWSWGKKDSTLEKDGWTILHMAADELQIERIDCLLNQFSANPLITNNAGLTPLALAQKKSEYRSYSEEGRRCVELLKNATENYEKFKQVEIILKDLQLSGDTYQAIYKIIKQSGANAEQAQLAVSTVKAIKQKISRGYHQSYQVYTNAAANNLAAKEYEDIQKNIQLFAYYRALKSYLQQVLYSAEGVNSVSDGQTRALMLLILLQLGIHTAERAIPSANQENLTKKIVYSSDDILHSTEEVARIATLRQENIKTMESPGVANLPTVSFTDTIQRVLQGDDQKLSEAEQYIEHCNNEDACSPIERKAKEDAKVILKKLSENTVKILPDELSSFCLKSLLGNDFTSTFPIKAFLSRLVDLSHLSKAEEESAIRLFLLYPYLMKSCTIFEDISKYKKIISRIFSFIKNRTDKESFINNHFNLNEVDKAYLIKICANATSKLEKSDLIDLFVLLIHRYHAEELLETIPQENLQDVVSCCKKILTTAKAVDIYLSQAFVYTNNNASSRWNPFSASEEKPVGKARQQAFALAYDSPDALTKIPRNSQSLATHYEAHMRENQTKKYQREFTVDELRNLRRIDQAVGDDDIDMDDSASQFAHSTVTTTTTELAAKNLFIKSLTRKDKSLAYEKAFSHYERTANLENVRLIKQLGHDIQSHLTAMFNGILRLSSKFVERANTTYADTAIDIFKILKELLPDPMSRLVASGLINTSQFFLDQTEIERFVKMSKNLRTFGEIDIITQELTGLIIKNNGDECIRLVSKAPNKEEAYKKLSQFIVNALEASVLKQLKDKEILVDTIHLGAVLFEGFSEQKINLRKALEEWQLPKMQLVGVI